jgi:hypothetical protein
MSIFRDGARGRKLRADDAEFVDDRTIGALVEFEIRASALRNAIFDTNVLDESSWPIVRRLFDAHLKGVSMRTKELYVDTEIPPTTVHRYVDHLEKCEVVRRGDDPSDNRVTLVSLTERAALWLREYYTQVFDSERRLAENGRGIFGRQN